jgi:hypothetical protein
MCQPPCVSHCARVLAYFHNHISIRVSPLLIVWLSILNVITLAKCLDHQTKKLLTTYTFALSFLFFSFFFYKPSTWSSWPSPQWSSFICSTTWNIYQPISHTLRAHRLVARVSSIHQNQTRAFSGFINSPKPFILPTTCVPLLHLSCEREGK